MEYVLVPFKSYYSFPKMCGNVSENYYDYKNQYQKCHKDCHTKWEVPIDDYFTASKKFCCLVFDILSCETSILSKCDDDIAEKNQKEVKALFFKSCKTWQNKCYLMDIITNWSAYIALGVVGIIAATGLGFYWREHRSRQKILSLAYNKNISTQSTSTQTAPILQESSETQHEDPVGDKAKNSDINYNEQHLKQFGQDHKNSFQKYFDGKINKMELYRKIAAKERSSQKREGILSLLSQILSTGKEEMYPDTKIPRTNREFREKARAFIEVKLKEEQEMRALTQWLEEFTEAHKSQFRHRHDPTLKKYFARKLSAGEAWEEIAYREYKKSSEANQSSNKEYLSITNPEDSQKMKNAIQNLFNL